MTARQTVIVEPDAYDLRLILRNGQVLDFHGVNTWNVEDPCVTSYPGNFTVHAEIVQTYRGVEIPATVLTGPTQARGLFKMGVDHALDERLVDTSAEEPPFR